ncbi:MAG: hypothetical protein WBG61_04780 [Desulfobacterales bacterium]
MKKSIIHGAIRQIKTPRPLNYMILLDYGFHEDDDSTNRIIL